MEEVEPGAWASAQSSGGTMSELEASLESCVSQLHALYRDREASDDLAVMVRSLEEQVAALLEECMALRATIADRDDRVRAVRDACKNIISSISGTLVDAI